MEVNTNGALVNQVWDSLNEMAINRALSQQCIPPVLVGYFGSAPSARCVKATRPLSIPFAFDFRPPVTLESLDPSISSIFPFPVDHPPALPT